MDYIDNPDLNTFDVDKKEGFKPSVICCCVNNKRILMLHKKVHGVWMFPQGSITNGESGIDAVTRNLKSELSEKFFKSCDKDIKCIGEDKIEFLPDKFDPEELLLSTGEKIKMIGKKYYFYVINSSAEDVDYNKDEYDDYFWLQYKGAILLADKISQKGRRRISLKVIDALRKENLID